MRMLSLIVADIVCVTVMTHEWAYWADHRHQPGPSLWISLLALAGLLITGELVKREL